MTSSHNTCYTCVHRIYTAFKHSKQCLSHKSYCLSACPMLKQCAYREKNPLSLSYSRYKPSLEQFPMFFDQPTHHLNDIR